MKSAIIQEVDCILRYSKVDVNTSKSQAHLHTFFCKQNLYYFWPGHLVIVQAKYSDLIRCLQNDYVLVVSSTVLHVGQLFENCGHQNSLYWVMEQQEGSMMLIIRTNQAYHSLKDLLSCICRSVRAL